MTRKEINKLMSKGYKIVNLRNVNGSNSGTRPIQVWMKVF